LICSSFPEIAMRALLAALVGAFVAGLSPSSVQASLITYSFNGVISSVTDSSAPLGDVGGISVGDLFTGSFQFETNDAGADLDADPNRGLYFLTNSVISSITMTVNGLTFTAGPGAVDIRNNAVSTLSPNTDLLNYTGGAVDVFPPGWSTTAPLGNSLQVAFADASGTVYPGDALPTSFNVSDFDAGQMALSFANVTFPGGSDVSISIVGDLNLAAVPEPSSMCLAGVAAAAATFAARRRRKSGMRPGGSL
jgi:hypothetical protein